MGVDWSAETMRATALLIGASALLGAAGLAGLGGSLPLALAYLAVAAGLARTRDRLAAVPRLLGHDLAAYGRAAWVAAVVAAVVVLATLGASAAELQALAGMVGLAGMLNYFLRPLYYVVVVLARYVTGARAGSG